MSTIPLDVENSVVSFTLTIWMVGGGLYSGIPQGIRCASEEDMRDEHVAHPVNGAERCHVLVAARGLDDPALGIGVYSWFFASHTQRELLGFITLIRFVMKHVDGQIKEKGDKLAKALMGPRSTWQSANRGFAFHVRREGTGL